MSFRLEIELFSRAVRGHWLHWQLDVTFEKYQNHTLEKKQQKIKNLIHRWCLIALK